VGLTNRQSNSPENKSHQQTNNKPKLPIKSPTDSDKKGISNQLAHPQKQVSPKAPVIESKKSPKIDITQKSPQKIPESGGPRYTFSTEIPETYDDFFIRAIPRDPEWLYVYWELPSGKTGKTLVEANHRQKNENQFILRLKESSTRGEHSLQQYNNTASIDLPVDLNKNYHYVKIPVPGKAYTVECGEIKSGGAFFPVSGTSFMSPPADLQSIDMSIFNELVSTEQINNFSKNTGAVQSILQTPKKIPGSFTDALIFTPEELKKMSNNLESAAERSGHSGSAAFS
jgi:hypothetical protein